MRILHTSDWHIGKRLQNKSRLVEQQNTLKELAYICKNAKVDAVIVAGDCFDTFIPSAQAQELFYSAALEIARHSSFIAIAGNHDDNERFEAPRGIAKAANIILAGGLDNSYLKFAGGGIGGKSSSNSVNSSNSGNSSNNGCNGRSNESANASNSTDGGFVALDNGSKIVAAGEGHIRLRIRGQNLNLALLPYPSLTRTPRLNDMQGDSYEHKMKNLIDLCCGVFQKGDVNIFCSHLFMSGSEACDGELGGAQMLPTSVLPNSTYTALGHIHKPQTVSRSKNAYYSGSLLSYSFDDVSKKRYILIDTDGDKLSVEDIPITTGRMPVRVRAQSVAQSLDLLEQNKENLVELTYFGTEPLRPSDVTRLKAFECFCKLNIETTAVKKETAGRENRTTSELFTDFYKKSYGTAPDDSIVEMFLKIIAGEYI